MAPPKAMRSVTHVMSMLQSAPLRSARRSGNSTYHFTRRLSPLSVLPALGFSGGGRAPVTLRRRAWSPWRPDEDSKDPYPAHSLSPGTFFDGAQGLPDSATSGPGSLSDEGSSPIVFRNASTRLTGGGSCDGEGAAWAAAGAAGRALGAVSCSSGGRVYTPAKSKSVRAAR